jgi:hypothetical protein
MERSIGIDMDAMRKMAWADLSENIQDSARSGRKGSARLPCGSRIILEGGVLKTYLPPKSAHPTWDGFKR